ncbi:MAG: hypothetical protein RIQ56_670 [Candidatus Parcubacteria bacterium]|jgi:hypothetical protein
MKYALPTLIVLCVGIGLLVTYQRNTARTIQPEPAKLLTPTVQSQAARAVPAGYREYRSDRYRFSLLYPDSLSVSEYEEGGGATTVTFQNAEQAQGFQIFIAPFAAPQITEEQFKKDNPSGVRDDLQDITIDGALAASFYSTSGLLGETAEIWIVHGGFLYEATTLKLLAPWLSDIMNTWKFL